MPTGEPTSILPLTVAGRKIMVVTGSPLPSMAPVTVCAPPLKSISSDVRVISPSVRARVSSNRILLSTVRSIVPVETGPLNEAVLLTLVSNN